jgi:hypothetical protein
MKLGGRVAAGVPGRCGKGIWQPSRGCRPTPRTPRRDGWLDPVREAPFPDAKEGLGGDRLPGSRSGAEVDRVLASIDTPENSSAAPPGETSSIVAPLSGLRSLVDTVPATCKLEVPLVRLI